MRIWILIILMLASGTCAFGQKYSRSQRGATIDFYKEDITLTVSDSMASVAGIYWFRNPTEMHVPYPVSFPFYVDSTSLFPDSITAYVKEDSLGKPLPAPVDIQIMKFKSQNSIGIRVPITAKGTTVWHLDYSQKILANHARYILTSTAAWGRPLEDATYKFVVPVSYDSVQVWPIADTSYAQGDKKIYLCHKVNFMPKQDMEIFWKTK